MCTSPHNCKGEPTEAGISVQSWTTNEFQLIYCRHNSVIFTDGPICAHDQDKSQGGDGGHSAISVTHTTKVNRGEASGKQDQWGRIALQQDKRDKLKIEEMHQNV